MDLCYESVQTVFCYKANGKEQRNKSYVLKNVRKYIVMSCKWAESNMYMQNIL